MVCTGAWAQVTAITDIAQLEAGAAYNLRCCGGCSSPWMWDDAEASPTLYGHADYGSLFMFEAVEGGYYMKSLSSNKYVNVPNTDNQTLATLDDDASTIWTLVNVGSGIAIRPSGSNYGLNNNQDQNKIKLNASESGNPCSLWKFYKIEQKGWTPNLSNKSIANIAEKATSLTAATSAEDNNHWYLMTQTRGTETPVVATTSGERIKRSGGAVTQYTTNIQNYLVRLIPAGTTDGYYKLQFGNGLYFGSNQRTYANNADAAVYSYDSEARASTLRIYNTTGSGTGFGINLTKDGTEYGKTLDNQGNGGNVVFWGQGQKQNNSGNDFWQFYPVELQEGENYYVRPTFVSTNSTETGSQEASKLCDENNGNPTGSKWGEAYSANPETKLYAIVRADNTILKEYVMFNGNDTHDWPGRRLTAWTLEGSNSQSGPWTLIDNKTGQTQNDANYGANAYSTESNEAVYSYYKLTLGAIDGNGQHADMFQISDLLFKVEEKIDWEGLQQLVTEARNYTEYIGSGLGKYTWSNSQGEFTKDDWEDALDAYQSFIDSQDDTIYSVDEMKEGVQQMMSEKHLNMPETGKFYRFKGQTGRYINSDTMDKSSDDLGLYTMKVLEGNESKSVFCLTDEYHLISYQTGMSFSWGWKSSMVGANHDCTWTISEAEEAIGKYTIECPDASTWSSQKYLGDVTGQAYLNRQDAKNANSAWTIEEVTELPVSLSAIDGHCYGTLYTPVNLSLISPNYGVNFGLIKAYAVEVSDDRAVMANVGDVIPANTAVVLYSNSESATSTSMYVNGQGNITYDGESNALAGVLATTNTIPDGGVMTMQNYSESGIGFYSFTGTTLKGFKAYLPKRPGVKAFSFNFEEEQTTAIVNAIAAQNTGTAYDLTGRQVRANAKGISIENGKKVIR